MHNRRCVTACQRSIIFCQAKKKWLEKGESSRGKDHHGIERENPKNGECQLVVTTRHVKLDFPRFNGEEDPTIWVCRAERFFRFQGSRPWGWEDNSSLFSPRRRSPDVLQILRREGREVGWAKFTKGLFTHLGPNQFYDPFGELTKL
jgi:hypothetical protein